MQLLYNFGYITAISIFDTNEATCLKYSGSIGEYFWVSLLYQNNSLRANSTEPLSPAILVKRIHILRGFCFENITLKRI